MVLIIMTGVAVLALLAMTIVSTEYQHWKQDAQANQAKTDAGEEDPRPSPTRRQDE